MCKRWAVNLQKAHPAYFEREVDAGGPDDVAMIAYTSGTTGTPKGALLSHRNMVATAENFVAAEHVKRGDNWLAYLPMAWVGDVMLSLAAALVGGVTVNTPEGPETVQRDLRELGPHAILAPPRIWESILTQLQVKAADASWLKRHAYELFRRIAERRELLKSDGKRIPLRTRLGYSLGELSPTAPCVISSGRPRRPGILHPRHLRSDASRRMGCCAKSTCSP